MGQNGQVVGCNLNFFMGLFFVTTVVLDDELLDEGCFDEGCEFEWGVPRGGDSGARRPSAQP